MIYKAKYKIESKIRVKDAEQLRYLRGYIRTALRKFEFLVVRTRFWKEDTKQGRLAFYLTMEEVYPVGEIHGIIQDACMSLAEEFWYTRLLRVKMYAKKQE